MVLQSDGYLSRKKQVPGFLKRFTANYPQRSSCSVTLFTSKYQHKLSR